MHVTIFSLDYVWSPKLMMDVMVYRAKRQNWVSRTSSFMMRSSACGARRGRRYPRLLFHPHLPPQVSHPQNSHPRQALLQIQYHQQRKEVQRQDRLWLWVLLSQVLRQPLVFHHLGHDCQCRPAQASAHVMLTPWGLTGKQLPPTSESCMYSLHGAAPQFQDPCQGPAIVGAV